VALLARGSALQATFVSPPFQISNRLFRLNFADVTVPDLLLSWFTSRPSRWEQWTYNRLHGVTSQKTVTAVRTSNVNFFFVKFEVLKVMTMKSNSLFGVTPCSLVKD
jgi:hypothetical protein